MVEDEFQKSEATKASLNFYENGLKQYRVTSQLDPEDFGIVELKNDEEEGDSMWTAVVGTLKRLDGYVSTAIESLNKMMFWNCLGDISYQDGHVI